MPRYESNRVAVYHQPFRPRTDPQPEPTFAPVLCWPRTAHCPSRLAIVGEGPGSEEDLAARITADGMGVPFVGRSGSELDRFLRTYDIDPDRCMITNIGRVFKLGNPDPTSEDIKQWESVLWDELRSADPLWIAAVGRISTRYFLGDVDINTVHGIPYVVVLPWLNNGRGDRVVVIPITHPAAGFYATEAQALIAYDFAALDATIDGRLAPRDAATYDQFPNPDYRDLTDDPADLLEIADDLAVGSRAEPVGVAVDTEGVFGGRAWGLSYSTRPGMARVIRRVNQLAMDQFYRCLIQGIKEGKLYVILHNSLHDLRVLRELGILLPGGSFVDTMVFAYHLCVEPQGLKSLAYRHAGMEMDSYDEVVGPAQDRIAVEYYETIEGLVEGGVVWGDPGGDRWIFTTVPPDEPATLVTLEFESRVVAAEEWSRLHGGGYTSSKIKKIKTKPSNPLSVGPFRYIHPYTILERDKESGQLRERTKTPQQIDRRVKAALGDYRAGKITAAQLRKRWEGTDELVAEVVEEVIGPMREAGMDDLPLERAVHYAAADADATKRVEPLLRALHHALNLDKVSEIDHAIIPMVDEMQAAGIPIDKPYLERLSADLARRMVEKQNEIKSIFGVWINPNSGEQVADLLFRPVEEGGYGLVPTKQTKGRADKTGEIVGRRGSTVDKVMEGLRDQHPIIPLIMDYRGLLKAKTSFVDVALRRAVYEQVAVEWDEYDRPTAHEWMWVVHCNFRITRVSSGRLSATGPNLLAVMGGELGNEVRNGYVAGNPNDGFEFIEWDLDQVEMRVMASESGDEFLIDIINAGEDIHTGTANKMFKLGLPRPYRKGQIGKDKRDPAKRTGFGVITGIQGRGLVDQMRLQGILVTEEEATRWIADWLAACPGVTEYMYSCHREARAHGFVREWAGRIRYLPGIHSPFKHIRAEAGRQSHSHKIQGGAQSVMKRAMATIYREVLPYWRSKGKFIVPILQIHDALMFRIRGFSEEEIKELDGMVRGAMFAAAPDGFKVPLEAGMVRAPRWGDMEH